MSHTYSEDGVSVHYNSDWSGDVTITKSTDDGGPESIQVPAEVLLKAVAYGYVMPKRISDVEQSDYEELLR